MVNYYYNNNLFILGNALVAAENFCNRGNLHRGYIDEIRNFLRQNTQPQQVGKPHVKPQTETQKKSETKTNKQITPLFQGSFKFPKVILIKIFIINRFHM
jgi:hypothetical protein